MTWWKSLFTFLFALCRRSAAACRVPWGIIRFLINYDPWTLTHSLLIPTTALWKSMVHSPFLLWAARLNVLCYTTSTLHNAVMKVRCRSFGHFTKSFDQKLFTWDLSLCCVLALRTHWTDYWNCWHVNNSIKQREMNSRKQTHQGSGS